MAAGLHVGGDLLYGMILKHIVFCGHVKRGRLKGEPEDAVFIQRLPHLPVQRGLKHIIDKIKSAESEGNRHDDHRTQQQLD